MIKNKIALAVLPFLFLNHMSLAEIATTSAVQAKATISYSGVYKELILSIENEIAKIKTNIRDDQDDLDISKEDANRISYTRKIKENTALLKTREADLIAIKKSSLSTSLQNVDSAQTGKKSFAELKREETKLLPSAKIEVGTPSISGSADPKAPLTIKLNAAKTSLNSSRAKTALAQFEVDQHENMLAQKLNEILTDEFSAFVDSTHNDLRYNARGNVLAALIGKYNLARVDSKGARMTTSASKFVETNDLFALENDKMAHRIFALTLVGLDNPKSESTVEGVQSFLSAFRNTNKNKKINTAQPNSYLGMDKARFLTLSLEESDTVMDLVNRVMKLRGGPKYLLHSFSYQNTDLNLSDDVKARLLADSAKLSNLIKGSDLLLSVKKDELKKVGAELGVESHKFSPIETRENKLRAAVSAASNKQLQTLETKFNEGLGSIKAEKIQGLASKSGSELATELNTITRACNAVASIYADAQKHITNFTLGLSSK